MSLLRPIYRQASLLRTAKNCNTLQLVPARNGHVWSYRVSGPAPPKTAMMFGTAAGAYMWWWVLWHLWTEPEHIYGEFPYPDPAKWTNEELGIPPDDAE